MFLRCLALLGGLLAATHATPAPAGQFSGKKILYVDSYDDQYEWSQDISRAAVGVIAPSGADLRIVRMGTKGQVSEEYKIAKGKEVYEVVKAYRPDVVIASDDNASKYVVAPYLKDSGIPVVFCGINWDASPYGFPTPTITGMIERHSIDVIVDIFKAAGGNPDRVAMLIPRNESELAILDGARNILGVKFNQVRFTNTFAEWKAAYLDIQKESDLIIFQNYAGIEGWDEADAKRFIAGNTKALTASGSALMAPYVALTYAATGAEQGQWAARTALRILGGTRPSEIPVTHNKSDMLIINAKLAGMARVKLPPAYFAAAAKTLD